MMRGGFFDNMWDPYSGAYRYPRVQPRPRYNRPRAPVYNQYGPSMAPEYNFAPVVEEPMSRKAARTIPVSDGNVPVAVSQKAPQAEVKRTAAPQARRVVSRFKSEDTAAKKIQAAYRGYSVRKTQPLKHLREIKKVREELESLKRKSKEEEQRKKLCSDPQERLRWTEGIMLMLLRLDSLQGVHPEVRFIRKGLTKELLGFQEIIDSMTVSGEAEGKQDDGISEKPDTSDTVKEMAIDGLTDSTNAEGEEKMEVEGRISDGLTGVRNEASGTVTFEPQQSVMQNIEPHEASEEVENEANRINVTEHRTPGKHVHQVHSDDSNKIDNSVIKNANDQRESLAGESIIEGVKSVLRPSSIEADVEVPMAVEEAQTSAQTLAMDSLAPAMKDELETMFNSSQSVPYTNIERVHQEPSSVDDTVTTSPSSGITLEPMSKGSLVAPANHNDDGKLLDPVDDVDADKEAEKLPGEAENLSPNETENAIHEANPEDCESLKGEGVTGSSAPGDEWKLIPLINQSMSLETQCVENSEVGQPQVSTADDGTPLSERELLLQLLEENRKLKDVVGKVLHWGKQQNDVIHSLATRIEQLERSQLQSNLLEGEKYKTRKRISNDASYVGDRDRPRRKAERGGRRNTRHLNYGNLEEWPSAESDEFF
ncbi:uncharacterized protein [Physcomitrium patens]|uniref:BAG domain-containing protein n=1 Tax=Physcomitrium patens TaxID=3218 RepID=A0A2K1JKM9_PHYPA|nr:BAG family molecular chaperone regulator 6-like [Physcomitrium patens]PNR42095.1 hypothetical protein PHYPA_016924 [Physcomitrium patens]|eukprot:XP_024393242.1 BAG family molecular chaperone regulator 6-like [Physcomitrella patens]